MKKNSKKIIASLLFILILASPIIIYINNFGYFLSPSHQRWSEFGEIMSGIYSPLIASIALLFLFNQLRSQLSIDKHQHDSAIIERSRHDIDFYIDKLELYLERKYEKDVTIKQYLNSNFSYLKNAEMANPEIKKQMQAFAKEHAKVFDTWLAIYPLLQGLESINKYPYLHNFRGSKLRISVSLSYATCVAIDNLYYCVSEDIQKGKYLYKRME